VNLERVPDLTHADISLHVSFIEKETYYALERTIEQEADYLLLASRED
jgi:hypothetical protein